MSRKKQDVSKEEVKMIKRVFGKDFNSSEGALTLPATEVCDTGASEGYHSKTHDDGWTIEGEIQEDYYLWVNEFKATHPKLGKVWGNFEDTVFATSKEAYDDFYSKHKPEEWDYGDI